MLAVTNHLVPPPATAKSDSVLLQRIGSAHHQLFGRVARDFQLTFSLSLLPMRISTLGRASTALALSILAATIFEKMQHSRQVTFTLLARTHWSTWVNSELSSSSYRNSEEACGHRSHRCTGLLGAKQPGRIGHTPLSEPAWKASCPHRLVPDIQPHQLLLT